MSGPKHRVDTMCFFAIFLNTSYGISVLYFVPVVSDLASIQNWPLYVQTNVVYDLVQAHCCVGVNEEEVVER